MSLRYNTRKERASRRVPSQLFLNEKVIPDVHSGRPGYSTNFQIYTPHNLSFRSGVIGAVAVSQVRVRLHGLSIKRLPTAQGTTDSFST